MSDALRLGAGMITFGQPDDGGWLGGRPLEPLAS